VLADNQRNFCPDVTQYPGVKQAFSLPRLGWFYGFRNSLNMFCESVIATEKLYHHDLEVLKIPLLLIYHKTS